MPYKVVQTIETGEACLSVVPSGWEADGILYWPKKHLISKLSLEENSIPSEKWEKFNCIKKRELPTRAEAYEELSKMEEKSDTEMDEKDFRRYRPYRHVKARQSSAITSVVFAKRDFNELAEMESRLPSQKNPSANVCTNTMEHVEQVSDEPVMEYTQLDEEDQSQIIYVEPATVVPNLDSDEITNIIANQRKILENQEKILQSQAKLLTYSEYVLKAVNERPLPVDPDVTMCIDEDFNPVNSKQELEQLEDCLKDDSVVKKYVRGMSYICGVTGKANGIDCCYKLIDYFITRQFLLQCSWTGNSRLAGGETSNSSEKVGLKFFKKIRALFLKLIMLADKDFSEMDCDNFFKRIIRNGKQRVTAKTATSKHRNRPKQMNKKENKPDYIQSGETASNKGALSVQGS